MNESRKSPDPLAGPGAGATGGTNLGIRFWGVRGSCPAAYPSHMRVGGNTPCVQLRVANGAAAGGADAAEQRTVVLDAGTGIIALGREIMRAEKPGHVIILLTHYHWDHICGLPFFAPAFMPGWKVDIYAPGESAAQVEEHIAAQMRAPFFPVEIETWLADVSYHAFRGPMQIGSAQISHFTVQHPGATFGYRIDMDGRSLVYAPDSELALPNKAFAERRNEFDDEERTLLDEMKAEEDAQDSAYMEDVDLLIHDAQYTRDEYRAKRGWGHSCYIDVVNAAADANVRQLYLFSHDPAHDDDEMFRIESKAQLLLRERQSNMSCLLAREGVAMELV